MEASSADWATGPQKNGAGNVPVISVSDAINTDSSLQLARTEMSPANHLEHSRKHRQRTVVRERRVRECSNCCGTLTLKRADVRQIDVGDVCNITQVIGQHEAPTVIKIHSVPAVLAADIADDTNDFTSECTFQRQSEDSRNHR